MWVVLIVCEAQHSKADENNTTQNDSKGELVQEQASIFARHKQSMNDEVR